MIFTETKLKGAFIIDIEKVEDERGYFGRAWCKDEFEGQNLNSNTVQANMSYNKKAGTLRGMHYQTYPFTETKTVRCTSGSIYDVIIDLRPKSETYTQWIGVTLSSKNLRMLYVPEGFAHGYITLEDDTSIHYMVTEYYTPNAETGVRFDDAAFNIQWPIIPILVSEKDLAHPAFTLKSSMQVAHNSA
jgi:dTDP-4-dehydrorhamnose 3,5-epimerase